MTSLHVHYSDYASQPDVRIFCDQSWTTPWWGEVKGKLPEGVYLSDDGRFYSFDWKPVTCSECRKKEG